MYRSWLGVVPAAAGVRPGPRVPRPFHGAPPQGPRPPQSIQIQCLPGLRHYYWFFNRHKESLKAKYYARTSIEAIWQELYAIICCVSHLYFIYYYESSFHNGFFVHKFGLYSTNWEVSLGLLQLIYRRRHLEKPQKETDKNCKGLIRNNTPTLYISSRQIV